MLYDLGHRLGPSTAPRGSAADQRVHRIAGLRRRRPARGVPSHHPLGLAASARRARPQRGRPPRRPWVDDGDIITGAGVSAGMDMALHLVARLAGVDRAREVAAASSTTQIGR